jgi:hypothetical protein
MHSIYHFYTKVAGISHLNDDGSDRQNIARKCRPWESLNLVHDESNPHDHNAIKVMRENGEQLGYLSSDLAAEVVEKTRAGYSYGVYVKEITGGKGQKRNCGINLLVVVASHAVTSQQAADYINSVDDEELRAMGVYAAGACATRPENSASTGIASRQRSRQSAGCAMVLTLLISLVCGVFGSLFLLVT